MFVHPSTYFFDRWYIVMCQWLVFKITDLYETVGIYTHWFAYECTVYLRIEYSSKPVHAHRHPSNQACQPPEVPAGPAVCHSFVRSVSDRLYSIFAGHPPFSCRHPARHIILVWAVFHHSFYRHDPSSAADVEPTGFPCCTIPFLK